MKVLSKFSSIGLVLLILILLVESCKADPSTFVKNVIAGGALGTSYSITYLTDEEINLQSEIDSVFNVINRSMSTYIPDSDISKINAGDSTVVVDQLFGEVFLLSKKIYKKTNGYFDPTVGTLVNAWGFGPGPSLQMDSTKVDSLLEIVGFSKVELKKNGKLVKADPRVYLDFNAIAKGYSIDQIAHMMDERDIDNYLIEVGGEIVTKGSNRIKEKPWVLGIDDPQAEEGRRLMITLELQDRAMASSGNYRKFRIDSLTGLKYVHTIDPKTGYTKNAKILAVSVIASTCAEADAYATAFMAMSLKQSKEVISAQKELEVYIIYLNDDNDTEEFMTDGFRQLVLP
ncbi:FAD:protein FMN transferase [Eudoraea sp.]|uniref:FAD:protein FMN transferase n=1 Tax=Eudoraea sp. TaxID=1979955 RepID=UPI003C70FBFA